ncbi:MAG: hypothetical protein IJ193_06070 [Bacilli bacterium]|nr:hypothetical protein [Bacilli bacterium]
MEDTLEKFKLQHFKTYKNAIIDSIKNNTNVLTDEDITSLLKKPPLDSMDVIKSRFLTLAKKNKIVLDTESLGSMLDEYRDQLLKCVKKIKKVRTDDLTSKINTYSDDDSDVVIKLLKKDFTAVNKKIKTIVKEQYSTATKKLEKQLDRVFQEDVTDEVKSKIITDVTKFINGTYERQLLENIDIKILIKDTTLINLVKEQTERYLFTLNNSRLFKDNI